MAFKLARLPEGIGQNPYLFKRYWDETMSNIEKTLNSVLSLPAIEQAIQDAQDAADNANNAGDAIRSESSLVRSYVLSGSFVDPLITIDSAGLVTVKTHTRMYGDSVLNPSVSVTGGSFTATGATIGDTIRVYYSDPARSGGSVTYQFTKDPDPVVAQGDDFHSVGAATWPAIGTFDGFYVQPPGYTYVF